MDFKNGAKNIQTAGYNGKRTVISLLCLLMDKKREKYE